MSITALVALVALCAAPISLKDQLRQSLGHQYSQARRLHAQGQHGQARVLYQKLLRQVQGSPSAGPLRLLLAKASGAKKSYQFIELEIQAEHNKGGKRSLIHRKFRMLFAGAKSKRRKIALSHKKATLSLQLVYTRARGAGVTGQVKIGAQVRPIQLKTQAVRRGTRWQRKIKLRLNAHTFTLSLRAAGLAHPSQLPKSWGGGSSATGGSKAVRRFRFKIGFRKIKTGQVLQRIADLLGLKLKLSPKVKQRKYRKLTLQGSSRSQLLGRACRKLGVRCSRNNKELRVSPLAPAAPRPPKAPKPPTPPTPPRP